MTDSLINRRKALRQLTLVVSGTLSLPTLQAMSFLEQESTGGAGTSVFTLTK